MNFIAIVVVIISSFAAAYLIIRKEIKRCKGIDLILRLILSVKNRAMFYNIPFSEIIMQLKTNDEFYKTGLCDVFTDRLQAGMNVPDAWKDTVVSVFPDIGKNECDILIRFGTEMCCCNKDEIQEISDRVVSEIEELRDFAIEQKNIKSKSTGAVIVSFGLMIVLVFV
ncbi:MAG: stage III sporulation protein AB [Clostridia bacterium]|nr:stage III sporulation protein AB [Clostridia bacterium]